MDPLLGAGLSHKPSRSRNPTSLLTALLLLAAHVLEGLTFGFLSPLLPFFYTDIANDITRGNAGAVFGLILSSYLVALWAATPLYDGSGKSVGADRCARLTRRAVGTGWCGLWARGG